MNLYTDGECNLIECFYLDNISKPCYPSPKSMNAKNACPLVKTVTARMSPKADASAPPAVGWDKTHARVFI